MPTRVGLFGGTFNPPHRGHVAVLKAAARLARFDLLEVTVAGDPYLKRDATLLDAQARLAMAHAAFDGLAQVEVSDRELRRTGPTYTIDTVEELLGDFDAVDLIIGADLVPQIGSWHRAEELTRLVQVGVVPRPDGNERLGPQWKGYRIPMSPVDLSSTAIRDLDPSRADLDELLPEAVVPLYLAYRG